MSDDRKNQPGTTDPTKRPGQPDKQPERDPQARPGRGPGGQIVEVPGRPDADQMPDRDKAYGPGGAKPAMDPARQPKAKDRNAAPAEPDAGARDPNRSSRTAEGADTEPR